VILRAADELIATGGRSMLAKILKGSQDKKVLEHELDQCPVYGYYRELTLIASTQSLLLVDQLEPEDLIVVDYQNDQSVFNRPTSQELKDWLEIYSLGELWEKNVLGGRP
jgi:hypothetical protein